MWFCCVSENECSTACVPQTLSLSLEIPSVTAPGLLHPGGAWAKETYSGGWQTLEVVA